MPSTWISRRGKWFWTLTISAVVVIAIALGVGLSIGLNQGGGDNPPTASTPTLPPSFNNPNATGGTFWKPAVGETWQIVLLTPLDNTTTNASVYDVDLFTNPTSTFQNLQSMGRKVICYFSAGSYESNRPDSNNFTAADKGHGVDGWPGEFWLNTNSPNVRDIMTERLKLAAQKGCDGVDPDNVDAYNNNGGGLGLTITDAIDYLTFLAIGAHSLGMAIGLKNAGEIVNQTLPMMQWQVNEQCVQYGECVTFQPFIMANKPVFHIEYPQSSDEKKFTAAQLCGVGDASLDGFSTVLKSMDLGDSVTECSNS
ncbi:putative endo alpha-1,4-polygalactosaminidase [Hyaloscypha finlandica]|nr:putative endo alpha-1,4-polygalactosaminidase [Hyaloscypha finlandica]